MTLVGQLLQPQHGSISTVCERSLQQLEDLYTGEKLVTTATIPNMSADSNSITGLTTMLLCVMIQCTGEGWHLFENILLSHELLSFPVGFVDHDLQDILAIVGNIHHKKHQILQKLGDRSESQAKKAQSNNVWAPGFKREPQIWWLL